LRLDVSCFVSQKEERFFIAFKLYFLCQTNYTKMIKNTFILVFIFFTVAGIRTQLRRNHERRCLLEFNLLMSVGPGWEKCI
jgi:hypothetical protein